MRVLAALFILCSCLRVSAGEPEVRASRKELATLQGVWRLVEIEIEGREFKYPEGDEPRRHLDKGRVASQEGGKPWASLAVEPTLALKTLDLTRTGAKRPMEAIYTLDTDTWRICVNPATEGVRERPSDFSTKDRPGWKIWVLKRVRMR